MGNSKPRWNSFIFSNRLCFRVCRHVAFWLAFYFWLIVLSDIWIIKYVDHIPSLYTRIPLYILSTYLTLYFLVPRYILTKKYGLLFFAVAILSVLYPLI